MFDSEHETLRSMNPYKQTLHLNDVDETVTRKRNILQSSRRQILGYLQSVVELDKKPRMTNPASGQSN